MLKVMIAEDELLMREKLSGIIDWEANGFVLSAVASNGGEALDKYLKHTPDIVVTDIKMPVMDGLELSRNIISKGYSSKIILLTGYADFEYAREAVEIKAADYILKHRLTPELFLEKLLQLSKDISAETGNRQIILERELHDLLSGRPAGGKGMNSAVTAVLNRKNYIVNSMVDNIDLHKKNMDYSSFKMLSTRLDDVFSKFAAEQEGCVCLNRANNERILVIPAESLPREEKSYLFNLCRMLQHRLLEDIGISVSIAIGEPRRTAEGILASYDESKKLLEQKYFLGTGQIIDSRFVSHTTADPGFDWTHVINDIGEVLQSVDKEDILRYIDRLLLHELPAAQSKKGVKSTVMLLIEKVVQQLGQNTVSGLINGQTVGDYLEDLMLYDNIKDIHSGLTQLISAAYSSVPIKEFDGASKKMKEAMKYALEHFDEKNLIQNIADLLGISPIYFGKVFKEQTGMRFVDYLTHVRMSKAKELLATGKYKIYEVAEKVGFSNIQYFSQKFKKATGEKPYAFKERG